MSDEVRTDITPNGIMVVTINRPERRNALDIHAWTGLKAALAAAREPDVGAVVLTGAGGSFSAGGDLKTLPAHRAGLFSTAERLSVGHEVVSSLFHCPKPTVAAVEGPAVGVGWSLALACDLVVAASSAFFLAPFVERGLLPDGGIGWLLQASVGRHRAADLLLQPRRLGAAEAAGLGLVTRISDDGEALSTALGMAAALANGPRETLELTKQLFQRHPEASLDSYLRAERDSFVLNGFSGNPAEGAAAFLEKRPPRFGKPKAAE